LVLRLAVEAHGSRGGLTRLAPRCDSLLLLLELLHLQLELALLLRIGVLCGSVQHESVCKQREEQRDEFST
jgi:hypothetical protein